MQSVSSTSLVTAAVYEPPTRAQSAEESTTAEPLIVHEAEVVSMVDMGNSEHV